MPKKKLTKAQVKRKLKTMRNAVYDLYLDRLGYGTPNSYVPMTNNKLLEVLNIIDRAQKAANR
jgi:hypothetical protein